MIFIHRDWSCGCEFALEGMSWYPIRFNVYQSCQNSGSLRETLLFIWVSVLSSATDLTS